MSAERLRKIDKERIWHPFTQMGDWCAPGHAPLIIKEGRGSLLLDSEGREYLDGNSSIWTNIHGHSHPTIVSAIREQAGKLAHSSFLGFTNEPAIRLAEKLVALFPPQTLTRVFYSDDGSTAIEVAMKMAAQYWMNRGQAGRKRFVCLRHSYHGDTSGAMSVCDPDDSMHRHFRGFLLEQYPHELPSNEAGWRSLTDFLHRVRGECAALIVEPLVQCATGMRRWCATCDVSGPT
jgi:adenosylmethionine-8-amino-7-oxononanoate aminotransferase